jgi:hypothetical protein
MDDLAQRFAAIRHEIDSLKAALQTTADDAERHSLHARINRCIRESIQLIDQRLGSRNADAASAAPGRVPANQAPLERSVGDERS